MIDLPLPRGHVWLRLTQPHYDDPFDMSYAQRQGGRWNPPESWPTLYLNEDMFSVHAQMRHLFSGRGIDPEDLDDNAPVMLAAATLPQRQRVADVLSAAGVEAVGLPATYPLDTNGELVGHARTQPIGTDVHRAGLRGIWCRSAAGVGHELAWFPATRTTARPAWAAPLPYGSWRHATTLSDISG